MKTSEQTKRAISVGLITAAWAVIVSAASLFCGVTSARAQEPDNRIDWRWGRPGVMVVTNAPTAVTVTNIATEVATEVASGVANTMFGPRVTALEDALDGGTNNWNTAYGWGDHAGLYKASDWVPSWTEVTDKPATFPPETHQHDYMAITNPPWLTSFTETDEIALSRVTVLEGGTNNWNTAYGWGNHAGLYRAIGWVPSWAEVTGKPDLFDWNWNSLTNKPATFPPETHSHDYTAITNAPWLEEYTETDEIALSRITIIEANTGNWNTAYSWGNHAGLYKASDWFPSWTEVTGKPDLFDWNYDSLTNKPDLSVYQLAAYWPPNATASSWFTFVTNSGAITITGYNIAGGTDVVIPDYINGWPVTEIGDSVFSTSSITSIGGAGNVVTVGDSAFGACESLTSASLPQVQTVGVSAFADCGSLASV